MWKEVPKLLFVGSQRVGWAAAECTGAIGAAILSCQGATLPEERQERDNKKSQRGGRRSAASAPVKRQTDTSTSYPPFALIRWCESLLKGEECTYTGAVVSASERELVLRCMRAFLRHCGSELLPKASIHTVRALLKLLDSPHTHVSYVSAMLDLLREALAGCKPQEGAQVLPDLLDVLLGWAVDPAADQSTRYAQTTMAPVRSVCKAFRVCLLYTSPSPRD